MIRITTEVVCDGCGAIFHGYRGPVADRKRAKAEAQRQGWRSLRLTERRADYCPKCAPMYCPSRCRTRHETVAEFLARLGKHPIGPEPGTEEAELAEVEELTILDEYTEREAAAILGSAGENEVC